MALPEKTTYSNYSGALKPFAAAASKLGGSLPKARRGAAPVDQYSSLASRVKTAPVNASQLGSVSVPYGGSTKYEKFHPGIDIANKIGTALPSFTGGKVKEVVTGKKQGSPGYGNYIIVEDKYGNKHRYSHLAKSYVKIGQPVTRGSVIGAMGNTGQTYSLSGGTGSHLDYRIRDAYNKYVNPSRFLK